MRPDWGDHYTAAGLRCVAEDASKDKPKARFSLAGVQMKLSVMKNTGKGGGLTLPMGDEQGQYIAKFPSTAFPGVSENEFANLALAAAIGMEVPERELVEKSEFDTLSDGKVLLVKRFDRGASGERIHIEDFAQVFGVYPSRKCDGAAHHDIAAVLSAAVSSAAALEFVRRLALMAITGNGDMHVKNWSLIYRRDGDKPELAPIYDVLSTVPYLPADALALSRLTSSNASTRIGGAFRSGLSFPQMCSSGSTSTSGR